MIQLYADLKQKILEIAEGDEEFSKELTQAIYNGLIELKEVYSQGSNEKDDLKIQQIRHKVKPTLMMFEFQTLIDELQLGKEIIESVGFNHEFYAHLEKFNNSLEEAIANTKLLLE